MQRFEQFQALRREADDLRQALEDRKVIERAKGLLMKQVGLDEEGAFRRLQMLGSGLESQGGRGLPDGPEGVKLQPCAASTPWNRPERSPIFPVAGA